MIMVSQVNIQKSLEFSFPYFVKILKQRKKEEKREGGKKEDKHERRNEEKG